jgi:RNA polymerase sigma-70 factor (ECF subfamily)
MSGGFLTVEPGSVPEAPASQRRVVDWFRQFRAPLRRFIARRRKIAAVDVDDVAQEVFLRLMRYGTDELVKDPRSYLFRIASNVAFEWSMRPRERAEHASDWLEEIVDDCDLLSEAERAERERELTRALADLPARSREVLHLHFMEGLSREEIAKRLNVSERIVKRDTLTAYAELRAVLHEARSSLAATRIGRPLRHRQRGP